MSSAGFWEEPASMLRSAKRVRSPISLTVEARAKRYTNQFPYLKAVSLRTCGIVIFVASYSLSCPILKILRLMVLDWMWCTAKKNMGACAGPQNLYISLET